jgi:type III restriction enzyme
MYDIEQAVNAVFTNLYLIDMDKASNITERVTKDYIRNLMKKELAAIGENLVSEDNLQSAKASFNVLVRQFVGISKISELYEDIEILNTAQMSNSFMSESTFKSHGGLVTSKKNYAALPKDEIDVLKDIEKDLKKTEHPTFGEEYVSSAKIIRNLEEAEYKSPINLTLLSHAPERDFVKTLVHYSKYIDTWVKSKDKGFYSIPYIHRPGTHSLQKDFNPDFFIKKENKVIVVEIKCESQAEASVKNKDKLEGAKSYFEKLNEKLNSEFVYEFHFLDPSDYTTFFQKVIVSSEVYKSSLQAQLESKTREELKGQV